MNNYTGYKEIELDETSLSLFYSDILPNNKNDFELLENEYLIIKDKTSNKIIDKYKWMDNHYNTIPYYEANSKMFGKVAPKDNDIYQHLALDSLYTNQVTIIRGKPGSGKSYLALSYLVSLWEKGEINKIVIFANPVAVRGAAKLGSIIG